MSGAQTFRAIGLMSGTSLDGLDVVYCSFVRNQRWHFEIHAAQTISYGDEWRERLRNAHLLGGLELTNLHVELGKLHGEWVNLFMLQHNAKPDFIASHGHTVFHQPQKGITLQIGSAPHIAAATGVDVVSDFRTIDVALGGQGAPLVPVGDIFLFGEYPLCLNLGGIANVSVKKSLQIEAFDISLCNIALNHFAEKLGVAYDAGGSLARSGTVNEQLLCALNALDFFHQPSPKSLGKEFWIQFFLPV
ncbi:MAG: anhydro-N-acetylmuramic acid kinase, partial [Flavobacteriales bacterium]